MRKWPLTSVTSTIGTLTRKIEPNQKCSRSAPPTMGPKATAMPEVAPQMPSAFWRSDGSVKMSVRMASEAGKTNAAATPISARAEISSPVLWLTAARTEKSAEEHEARPA